MIVVIKHLENNDKGICAIWVKRKETDPPGHRDHLPRLHRLYGGYSIEGPKTYQRRDFVRLSHYVEEKKILQSKSIAAAQITFTVERTTSRVFLFAMGFDIGI